MKKLLVLGLAPLAACSSHGDTTPGVPGQGSGTARTYQIADFSKVALRGSDDVDVRTGTGFSVRAEGPAAELDKLRIVKEGDTLRVGRIDQDGFHWGGHRDSDKVKIYVTMPRIAAADIAGSGDMAVDRAEGSSFASDNAGSGDLTVAALAVDTAQFSLAGSGDVTVTGTAKQLKIDIAGSGTIHGDGLKASGASISIAGSGDVRADVGGAASVSMMGSGDIDLGPNAKCSVSKMGSGTVKCGAGGSTE